MATGSPNREFTSEELDAMAAAELPVENPETSRTASAAPVASAPTAPEATGSPELAVGDGTPFSVQDPSRGPAMGPVAKLEAGREYSTEELDLLEQANKPKEFTSDELDKATVDALNDPKYIPTRDEYFDQKATKERMVAAGKLPGTAEVAAKAVGGLFVSAGDAFNMAVAHPLETIARSPATLQTGFGRASLEALKLGGWAKQALEGDPKYRDEATGEFFTFSDPDFLRQQMEQGKKLRPTNEEDLKDWEFENHIYKKGIDSEYQDLGQKAGPTELITRVLTGRNQNELPIESQSQVVEMVADPTNLIPFGAGAKALGLSRGMKLVSSQAAGVVEKLSGGLVKGNDVLAERFAKVVTNTTGLAPEDLTTMGKALNYGKNVGIGAGIAGGAAAVGAPPEVAAFITGFYPAYHAGLGVLRKIETGAGTTKIIMREAADATNGLDQAARAAVLANNSVPQVFKEVLERPSQFVSIESTPARLAANQALSPQMRAFMGKLSNPAIVQAVRGSSALAKGAVKGVAINAPFAALAYNAGEDDQAAGMLGAGVAFGAAGAGIDRFTGLQERRQQAAISDVSRMLVDVELNAGDVSKLMSTQTPDNLVKLAAMQGTFRNGLDFVPLSSADYNTNVQAQGGAGSAGLFVQSTPGERARIYINLDAKRQGIEPHEFGHALLASGALDGQQKYAARAWVEKAYGADGIKARASEYASAIIRAKNSEAFPDGNFEISPGTLASEMDNLTQGGLARGDMDGLDWARDEIFAETFAQASQSMDFSAIRRGAPAGGNVLTFAEGILGAQSRALSASGVRIDPQTGAPLDTPDALFKENPLLATDKNLIKQLGTYINNYRQWANDPTHEKPRPNKVAPSGRASDVLNNPQVTFYDRGDGVKATVFAVQDPVTGQAVLRDQRDLNAEHKKVREQLKALAGSRLLPDKDPVLGPKKTTDGRVTVRGRVLPQSFDFLNGFMPHIRNFARQFEALGAAGESMQVRYHAIGSGDSGAFQIKKLGNLEAITREVVPWGWELTKAGNLNATVLDLSQFRNRAMRAINDHNPALAVFEWDMGKIEGDLKQWMQNHRDELPGNNKIGDLKRDVLNSLVGVATTENRSRNPLHGSFGPGSAIKQFRLDRVDAAVGTGRQGFHFDYEKAKGNFMPDKPAPLPDLSRDLPTAKGQAMPDNMASDEQWDAYGENLRVDVESWSPARDTGRTDYEMMDVVDRFVDFARNNPQLSGEELSKQFYRAEKPTATHRKKLNTALENVGQPPKSIATPQGQAMPDAVGPKGKDVFARSLEDIKLSIPANERWIGTKLPGQPVRAADGRRFLEHDLNTKTGAMNVTQAAIDKAWADAIAVTGPAASRAISELQEKGFTMKPPPEAHWKAAENLPNKDRLWYEISSEAMSESFPDFSQNELGKTMDVTAATSPLADPNYNARLAIAILAEDFQKTPSVTPAVVQTSVKDALMGEFGKAEQRKVGSFGGTFRFLTGLSDDPPLTTNDRQVAASMGIPDSAFGTYPVLYELQSRFGNNLRDHVNANGGMNSPFGPFQSHQLQALSWVQQRAEQRLQRRTNITDEEAFNGDAYASAFKLAADDLREAGIDVPRDPITGLPRFTASVLSDPRVQQILTPPGTEFLKSTIQTMEMNTKLREDGKKFADALEESKKLAIPGNIKLAEQVLQRAAKSLTLRTADKADKSIKLPSPLSKLASVFGAANADITRIEFGRGTFQGDVSPNVRIPMDAIPEKYRPAFMSVLGKHFYQAAQAASRFKSVDPTQAQSHSIWMHGKASMDGLEDLAQALTDEGHEANISQRPNGVLIDVHPKFTEQGPVPISPDTLDLIAEDILGKGNSSVIPREYQSIYLEKQEYDSTILKATKELLNEHADQLSQAASISLRDAKTYLRGDKALAQSPIPLNRRAEKIRNSYRQRIDQLQSSEKELKSLFKNFEADTRQATGEMQKRIDAFKAKAARQAKSKGPQANAPSAEDLAKFK
jgi:hypothetical protein